MNRKFTACIMASALILSLSVSSLATDAGTAQDGSTSTTQEAQTMSQSVLYHGQLSEVVTDASGAPTRLVMESERYGSYVMLLSKDTLWVDAGTYRATDAQGLTKGESLYVFHSSISTRSLPPQSAAYVVVRNVPQDAGAPHYHLIEGVVSQGENGLLILVDQGGLYLSADAQTALSHYEAGKSVSLSSLQPGSRILAWYDTAQTSEPGQTYAHHLMLLPAQSGSVEELPEQEEPAEGAQLTMELDGQVPNMVGRYEKGTAMVPVAAVAQALGFDVTYTRYEDGSALVTVESDQFQVRLNIGQKLITGVTKIPDAVGMTAPMDYGVAPYIVDPGTTWAPARLFEMLGKTVTLDGTNLIIQ